MSKCTWAVHTVPAVSWVYSEFHAETPSAQRKTFSRQSSFGVKFRNKTAAIGQIELSLLDAGNFTHWELSSITPE